MGRYWGIPIYRNDIEKGCNIGRRGIFIIARLFF
jgi:hypothetical protein